MDPFLTGLAAGASTVCIVVPAFAYLITWIAARRDDRFAETETPIAEAVWQESRRSQKVTP